MSPRVRDASALRDFWASERERPLLAAMSLAMKDWDDFCCPRDSIVSITFWFGGSARSSSERSLRLSDRDVDVALLLWGVALNELVLALELALVLKMDGGAFTCC